MSHLPHEVLELVALSLDSKSLVAATKVCRAWKGPFEQATWAVIIRHDWHYQLFPIQAPAPPVVGIKRKASDLEEEEEREERSLGQLLRLTKVLEWWSNAALVNEIDEDDLQPELPVHLVANIVHRSPLLTTLAIAIRDADYLERELLIAVETLHFLRTLQLDLFINDFEEPAGLTPLFGVSSQLEELLLAGNWYAPLYTTLPISPEVTEEDSQFIDPSLLDRAGAPWKLATLTVEVNSIALASFCPDLLEFDVKGGAGEWPFSVRALRNCRRLRKLEIHHIGPVINLSETLNSLQELTSLTTYLTNQRDASYLGFKYQGMLMLPNLQDIRFLSVDDNHGPLSMYDDNLGDIARVRSNLSEFRIHHHYVDTSKFFGIPSTVGYESWACANLQVLEFGVLEMIGSDEEKLECWRAMYEQLGQLQHLRQLAIRGLGLDASADSGFLALAGATRLENLTLVNMDFGLSWSTTHLNSIWQAVPNLRNITLIPLGPVQEYRVPGWFWQRNRDMVVNGQLFFQPVLA
ncbi:hypothetical protein BGX33_000271 [Mortierella sp. NVP41]|nr:hypothetical protein BGX33_000271 [Mortierella sp. NVP41]